MPKTPQRIRLRLGNHIFSQLETKNLFFKKTFFQFFSENLILPKNDNLAQKTTFSEAEIRHESGRKPFDQMNVLEETHRPKSKKKSTKYDRVLRIKQLFG